MKRSALLMMVLPLAAALTLVPMKVAAHVLRTDGTIGAVLHILPDDAPVAGEATTYELSFQDTGRSFSLRNCDCSIAFIKDGKVAQTKPLERTGSSLSTNRVTFADAGVYTFHVTGKPAIGDAFAPFALDYIVRVSDGQAHRQPFPPLLWAGLTLATVLILLYANAPRYTKKDKGGHV